MTVWTVAPALVHQTLEKASPNTTEGEPAFLEARYDAADARTAFPTAVYQMVVKTRPSARSMSLFSER